MTYNSLVCKRVHNYKAHFGGLTELQTVSRFETVVKPVSDMSG